MHPELRISTRRSRFFAPRILSLAVAGIFGVLSAPSWAQIAVIDQPTAGTYVVGGTGVRVTLDGAVGDADEVAMVSVGLVPVIDNRGIIGTDDSQSGLQILSGTVDMLSNASLIRGKVAVRNESQINAFTNSGSVQGRDGEGVRNEGTITLFTNVADGEIRGSSNAAAIFNSGHIGELINENGGSFYSDAESTIVNTNTIDIIRNNGQIWNSNANNSGNYGALENRGTNSHIGQLYNSGMMRGGEAIKNEGTIQGLTNTGDIQGKIAIANSGRINVLSNSGTIGGTDAISITSGASIGTIENTGKILGRIRNRGSEPLVINGASGSDFGLLSGVDSKGLIMSRSAVVFNQGNTHLNSDIELDGGEVHNKGATIKLTESVTIAGDYRQDAGAKLLFGVNDDAVVGGNLNDTGYGRLVVYGGTTIERGAAMALAPVQTYRFAMGQRFLVMSTAGDAAYNADGLKYSAQGYNGGVTGTVVQDDDGSHLLMVLGPAEPDMIVRPGTGQPGTGTGDSSTIRPANPATTSNASASLAGLFNYQGANPGLLNVFNPAAALGSTSEANRAGAQLAPSAVKTAASQGAQRATAQSLDIANARLDSMRSAPVGATGVSTGETGLQPAMWGQYFGGRARQSERDDVAGYDARFNGLLMGADTLVSENWRVGGMFSYARTNVDNKDANDGSEAKVDSYGLTAYAGYDGRPWYVNVMAGVVRQRYETERDIAYTGFAGHARGKYDGTQYVTSVLAGYPIALSARTTLTPLAGLSYSHLRQDGYTESGGNGAGLKVGSTRANSLKSDLGVKVEHAFDTSIGLLTPSAQLRWRHEFQNSRVRTASSFAADPTGSTAFTSLGATPVKDTGVFVLGATLATNDRLSIGVNYTLEAARGYTSQTGDLRVRYAF